jgi:universal stress protein A
MFEVRRILAPVDFSACSRRALEYALGLAQKVDASVDVLHVWTLPAAVPTTAGVKSAQGSGSLEAFARSEADRQMTEFLATVEAPAGGRAPRPIVRLGVEASAILEAAKDYDLLVMGTSGRTGISRILLGSIAEQVVRKASCPVLTVRGEKDGARERA